MDPDEEPDPEIDEVGDAAEPERAEDALAGAAEDGQPGRAADTAEGHEPGSSAQRPVMSAEWHAEVPWYLALGAFVAVVMWWQLARDAQPLWPWALSGAAGGLLLAWLRETLPYWIVRLLDRDRGR